MENRKKIGLTSNALKMIACVTMLIDHIGAVFFPKVLILRYIGRIAMPIYCYRAAIGGIYTRSRKKYIFRMALFAVLSEVPFDLAFQNRWIDWSYNNVMVTLLIGILCVMASETFKKKITKPRLWLLPALGVFLLGGVAAELAQSDYGYIGVAFIASFYFLRQYPAAMAAAFVFSSSVLVMIRYRTMTLPIEAAASAALLPIFLHNGKKGSDSKALQYGFYAFYPVHLAVIAAVYFLLIR